MRTTIMAACLGALAACGMPITPSTPITPPLPAAALPALPALPVLAAQGRYAEAIALLEAEAGARPQPSAALLGNLGYAYYLDGQLLPAQAALERACLMEPGNAVAWERLAALQEAMGDTGSALEAMRHARTLREAAATPAAAAPGGADLWPADMARVEVRQLGAGLVEVGRVPAPADSQARPGPQATYGQRLEVSNGNGVRGMAAAVAQHFRLQGMQVVRLTNTIPFNVRQTRLEIRGGKAPLLRIVLGRDLAQPMAEIKKPPAEGRRQAP